MDDVQVIRAIQSAGERMGYAKVKDEQFRVIEDVVRGRDTFVSLPTGYGVLICYGHLFDKLSVRDSGGGRGGAIAPGRRDKGGAC